MMRLPSRRERSLFPRMLLLATCVCMLIAMMTLMHASSARAGSFRVTCAFSHRSHDDPIVHDGAMDMSHLHDFFGSVSTGAMSTYTSMTQSSSSCSDRDDTAGYWHPHLTAGGRSVTARATVWYSLGGKPTARPFPRGLKLLAGDAMSTTAQSRRVVWWRCSGPGARSAQRLRTPPRCAARQQLTVNLAFPDCWNGRDLDSADHRSHMRYSRSGRCPATHRYGVPRVVLELTWPTHVGPARLQFASGGWQSVHADFWNTWNQRRLRNLVDQCINLQTDCGVVHHRRG